MFKVTGNDGNVYGLVDSRAQAEAIVKMKKLGRDGREISNPSNATKASSMTFTVAEVPDSAHPGHAGRI